MSRKNQASILAVVVVSMAAALGCRPRTVETLVPVITATTERSARRAFDGSPPVIPHKPLGATCVTCHIQTGMPVPNLGYAPANPHGNVGNLQNCRQCHLFQNNENLFAENGFAGLPVSVKLGSRVYPGAPPTIPHSLMMRENCLACHDGPSARPEIRCTHPERVNCRQCHLPILNGDPPLAAR